MNFFQEFRTETKILLVVALAAVVLAIGGILLLKVGLGPSSPTPVAQTPFPTPSPQPQAIDTSAWQTYRNDEFGFEVKYPESWFYVKSSQETIIQFSNKQGGLTSPENDTLMFQITVHDSPVFLDFFEKLQTSTIGERVVLVPGSQSSNVKVKEWAINSAPAIQTRYISARDTPLPFETLPDSDSILIKKQNLVFLAVLSAKSHTVLNANLEMLDQILSTFRFVE